MVEWLIGGYAPDWVVRVTTVGLALGVMRVVLGGAGGPRAAAGRGAGAQPARATPPRVPSVAPSATQRLNRSPTPEERDAGLARPNDPTVAPYMYQLSPEQQAVRSHRLHGAKRASVSVEGFVFGRTSPEGEDVGAERAVRASQATVDAFKLLAGVAEVYLVARVSGRAGEEEGTRRALEGVLGMRRGCVHPHKLLFCDTQQGLLSIVRQLATEFHVDTDRDSCLGVAQHLPQGGRCLLVGGEDAEGVPNFGTSHARVITHLTHDDDPGQALLSYLKEA